MKPKQLDVFVKVFQKTTLQIQAANGLGPWPIDEKNRPCFLFLNQVFARVFDHSRTGVLEIQGKKDEFEKFMKWPQWVEFFERIGFAVYYDNLVENAEFAINVLPKTAGRATTRKLGPSEQTALDAILEAMKKMQPEEPAPLLSDS
jgi:hypothetical protein